MKYSTTCEHCGTKTTAYTFNLNVPLVKALRQLVDIYEKVKRPIEMKELSLTNSQYTNFTYLGYYGLASYIPKTDNGASGWVPTKDGIGFIYGEISVWIPIARMGQKNLSADHEAWKTSNKEPVLTNVKEIDITSYKQKEEYQREKSNTLF